MKLRIDLQSDTAARWLLFLLPLLAFGWNLGSAPLFDVDEGAFSEATREMFVRHDFVSTWLNGAPRFDKPILIYWCQAIFVWLFGVNEWSFRLPSAIAASAWAWATAMFVWARAGRQAAFFAACIVTTSIGVMFIGRAATADALLNVLIVLALLDSWRSLETGSRAALLRSYVWIGLGVLCKGPIALLVPGAATLIYCASVRRQKDWLASVFDWQGWLILLAITVPWYAAALSIHGQAFIDGFLLKHNVERFSGSLEGHSGSIFYYLIAVPVLLLPWTGCLLQTVFGIRQDMADPLRRFLWIWALFVIAFFSLSGTKLPHYALYGCTPLMILVALNFERYQSPRLAGGAGIILLTLFLCLPSLVRDALVRGWISSPYYVAQLARIHDLQLQEYFLTTALGIIACALLIFKLPIAIWQRMLGIALIFAAVVSANVMPLLGELLQGPVMRAGLKAHELGEPAVLWNFQAPSFSVYSQNVTPNVQAKPGQLALTRVDRLPADQHVDVLFKEGGVLLVRVKP